MAEDIERLRAISRAEGDPNPVAYLEALKEIRTLYNTINSSFWQKVELLESSLFTRDGVNLQEEVFSAASPYLSGLNEQEKKKLPENVTTLANLPRISPEEHKFRAHSFDILGLGEDLQGKVKDWGRQFYFTSLEPDYENYINQTSLLQYLEKLYVVLQQSEKVRTVRTGDRIYTYNYSFQ
jgi:hypothetical protein